MVSTPNPVRRLQRDLASGIDADPNAVSVATRPVAGLSTLLRSFGSSLDDPAIPLPERAHGADWSGLIDRIRSAARHVRDVEAQAVARDEQVDQLLQRVRTDIGAAEARVRAAENRVLLAEAGAAEQIRSAEARVQRAEERARNAEEWLTRIQDVLQREFAGHMGATG